MTGRARTTHVLRSRVNQTRGVIGRYPGPDERYRFDFDDIGYRFIHMVGVRRPLRVRWLIEGRCHTERVLRPWLGWGCAKADTVVEERP